MSEQENKPPRLKKDGSPWGRKSGKHAPKQLTERTVARMKLPKGVKQRVIFDTGQKGLVLKVGQRSKSFSVVRYEKGKPRYFWLGHFDANGVTEKDYPAISKGADLPRVLTLSGARRATLLFRSNSAIFLNPKSLTPAKSFRAVAEEFLAKHAADFVTKPEIERCLNKYIYKALAERPFIEIKRSEVVALRSDVSENHGPSMAESVFALVRSIMHWYEEFEDDYVCVVKARRKKGASKGGRKRVLDPDEIKLVWKVADKVDYSAFPKLLLLTAQRRTTVAMMRWNDISKDGVWSIPRENDRSKGTAEKLKLPPLALAILKKIPRVAGCSYVFAGRYGDRPMNSYSRIIKEMRKLLPLDMPHWQFHDLRRTARTIMTDLRIEAHVAERVLGHAIEGVQGIYDRSLYFEQKAEALAKLAGYIEGLIHPTRGNVVSLAGRKARAPSRSSPSQLQLERAMRSR
jgi:integrase